MPTLTVTKTYVNGNVLSETDLDNIKNSIETFINTTKLDSANIQLSAIADSIGSDMTSTGANAIAATMSSTGTASIVSTMTTSDANAIAAKVTATGSNAIIAASTSLGTIVTQTALDVTIANDNAYHTVVSAQPTATGTWLIIADGFFTANSTSTGTSLIDLDCQSRIQQNTTTVGAQKGFEIIIGSNSGQLSQVKGSFGVTHVWVAALASTDTINFQINIDTATANSTSNHFTLQLVRLL